MGGSLVFAHRICAKYMLLKLLLFVGIMPKPLGETVIMNGSALYRGPE